MADAQKTADRPHDRTREGVVVSNAMDKTIVVAVRRRVRDPRYRKTVTVSKKLMAHDERNEANVGDRVVICESRPLSSRKRWRLRSIVERAVKDVPTIADEPTEESAS